MGNSNSYFGIDDFFVDKSKCQVHQDWTLSEGVLSRNAVSVFSAVHPQTSRKRPYMEKAVQCSKIYRHPGILKYLEGGIFGNEIMVVTEYAVPLLSYGLEDMSPLEITVGLSSIMEALVFLHDKAGVSHNNICPASIFITSEGIWKLWGFEYLCSFGELTRDHIERINQYCYEKAIPPDDKSHISPAYQHARDCFAFCNLIENIIAPLMPSDIPQFNDLLMFLREKGLNKNWSQRPRLSKLSENSFFCQEFLQLHKDITNILLLPSEKKDSFIKSLPSLLKVYPEELVASTLGPLLLSRQILLIPSAATHLMPVVLTPKEKNIAGLFSSSVFKEHLSAHLLRLFSIRDATIRKILLTSFENFAYLISSDVLKNEILPEVLLGIRDTDELLIVSTLKALGHLIPILGANTVIGSNRQQIFVTAIPKVGASSNDLKKNKKIKEKLALPIETPPQVNCELSSNMELSSSSKSISKSSTKIPERSSPDGGEINDKDDVFVERTNRNPIEENESWSEWEEMIDKPPPEIVGVLEMMTPEVENVEPPQISDSLKDTENVQKFYGRKEDFPNVSNSQSIRSDNNPSKSSGMKLNKSKVKGKEVSVSLGEEYTIKSAKVPKKSDSDMDLFADLKPNLNTKAFDLETMLIEASSKVTKRNKIPSVSDTLAELELQETKEGDGWQDDALFLENTISEEEQSTLKASYHSNRSSEILNSPLKTKDSESSHKVTTTNITPSWEDWE